MPGSLRRLTLAAATGVAVILPVTGTALAAAASAARPALAAHPAAARAAHPAAAPKPGRARKPVVLASNVSPFGYDAATDTAGTTYIGWIASHGTAADRAVYLCTLPRGATACQGGVASTASLGASSAAGLRVLVSGGTVTLVWSHTTTASENGPDGDEIAVATRQAGGSLSAASDVATAPSFGDLLDATVGPQGSIWVVSQPSSGSSVQILPGLSSGPVNRHTPYMVGSARLRFTGSTAVLAIQKAGAITDPVSYASRKGGSWSAFRTLRKTWTSDANLGLATTRSGIRLLASVSHAGYWPVVSRWTGSSFSAPQLTGDRNNCSPASHDPVADASGRMADVSEECSKLAVANLTDTRHAAMVRFASGGTFAGGIPQITTTPRGRGWVVWSIESSVSDKLLAAPVLLPARTRTVHKTSHGSRASLTGPASCLPPVGVHVTVSGRAAAHWHVASTSLRLDGAAHSRTLNGASLAGGSSHTLAGRVTFADGGARRTVTVQLTFRTCPNP